MNTTNHSKIFNALKYKNGTPVVSNFFLFPGKIQSGLEPMPEGYGKNTKNWVSNPFVNLNKNSVEKKLNRERSHLSGKGSECRAVDIAILPDLSYCQPFYSANKFTPVSHFWPVPFPKFLNPSQRVFSLQIRPCLLFFSHLVNLILSFRFSDGPTFNNEPSAPFEYRKMGWHWPKIQNFGFAPLEPF